MRSQLEEGRTTEEEAEETLIVETTIAILTGTEIMAEEEAGVVIAPEIVTTTEETEIETEEAGTIEEMEETEAVIGIVIKLQNARASFDVRQQEYRVSIL